MSTLDLAHGLTFEDLYDNDGLARIDALFVDHLGTADGELGERLAAARAAPGELDNKATADLMLDLAPHLNGFVGLLFGIGGELDAVSARHRELAVLAECKRQFVQRRASKAHDAEAAAAFDGPAMEGELAELLGGPFDQLALAAKVMSWMEDAEANAEALDLATRYTCWALFTAEGQARHRDDVLFQRPGKIDFEQLVDFATIEEGGIEMKLQPDGRYYAREGFHLTDHGVDLIGALDQATYCVICHHRGRDYCRTGMRDKKTGEYVVNPVGVTLEGCPLEERVSEMHQATIDGNIVAALAIVTVDNPLVAITGHRICNDCMKSCIYQKQDPVNIPQVETRLVKEILALPWGFEIYSLLTRWVPLDFAKPVPKAATGYKVLVVGGGPAGFSLAHFLLNEGHTVVVVDGLKIEPLAPQLCGVAADGSRVAFQPVEDASTLFEPLDDRVQAGFGGVAEYGITVRWDKNFLKVVRLLVERRQRLSLLGGVRFGGAITKESAFEMGFDHIALCMGAGKPTFLPIPNGLARGVRQASDFLMALQLTGAAKKESLANLQLRMPVVVIGGGLTAIDTATEALAYYVRQVEKFLVRYDALVADNGEAAVRAPYTEEEKIIVDEFIGHARAIAAERGKAAAENRQPVFIDLLNSWGGATIAYRRRMTGSPSYQLNHEEIIKGFEQGIRFAELLAPKAVDVDEYGHVESIQLVRQMIGEDGRPKPTNEETTLPARALLIAAGTQPNTVLCREHPGFAELDGKYFQAVDEDGNPVSPKWTAKPEVAQILMDPRPDGRTMSFFGDLHPSYAGNVVKALASAKQGYPVIERMLAKIEPTPVSPADLSAHVNHGLRAVVSEVIRLTGNVIEVVVRAPFAAKAFQPGQFFRLQNYEANSHRVNGTILAMEGVALTGTQIDVEEGLVSLIILDMGGSSTLASWLAPGESVIMMGPTGAPTEIEPDETVLLAGGGLGNAVLLPIAPAIRAKGSKVLYFAAYKGVEDRFHIDLIERGSDVLVWCCDEAPGFEPTRPRDKAFVGNIVQAMKAYGDGELGEIEIELGDVDRIVAIGSDIMMNAVAEARRGHLKDYFKPEMIGVASVNAPMQCMMKEICAQCLQVHRDPESGGENVVFTCFNQDQPLDLVDFKALRQRLCQNAVPEKLTRQWIARCGAELRKTHAPV